MNSVPQGTKPFPGKGPHTTLVTSLIRENRPCPRLLVSVRSTDEANRAMAGGVEILDVKEPSRGSLGMATIETIVEIMKMSAVNSAAIPVSVALGEMTDWLQTSIVPTLPAGITFAKLGLSHCASRADWQSEWQVVRHRFEQQSGSPPRWVAVAYADSNEGDSPPVSQVLRAAIESQCAGLLIDTWNKGPTTLIDHIDGATLTKLADLCHSAGLFLALAGKLRRESLSVMSHVPADVIAIRSAACLEADRTTTVDSTLIAEFKRAMKHCFEPSGQ